MDDGGGDNDLLVDEARLRVQPDFDAKTWLAFTRFALEGATAADVAQDLSMTVNAVVLAKFRVLRRLREEAGELTD